MADKQASSSAIQFHLASTPPQSTTPPIHFHVLLPPCNTFPRLILLHHISQFTQFVYFTKSSPRPCTTANWTALAKANTGTSIKLSQPTSTHDYHSYRQSIQQDKCTGNRSRLPCTFRHSCTDCYRMVVVLSGLSAHERAHIDNITIQDTLSTRNILAPTIPRSYHDTTERASTITFISNTMKSSITIKMTKQRSNKNTTCEQNKSNSYMRAQKSHSLS